MIIVRADANSFIGTGHIMRCKTIATSLREIGVEVVFVTSDNEANEIIKNSGFENTILDSSWDDLESEIPLFLDVIKKYNPTLVLVDSYCVTKTYFESIKNNTRIAYIDDLNKECWPVDILINYNIYSSVYDYSSYDNTNTSLLLGTSFAPLRTEFVNVNPKSINNKPKKILISAGGSDPENITGLIIESLVDEVDFKDIEFHFLVGSLNKRIDSIRKLALNHNNVVLHINSFNISELMKYSDIAVSASGTTLYELCACGVPTITYVLADNQLIAANQFSKEGIMINIGDCRNDADFINRMRNEIIRLINDSELRSSISTIMQNLVDGEGSMRIAKELSEWDL